MCTILLLMEDNVSNLMKHTKIFWFPTCLIKDHMKRTLRMTANFLHIRVYFRKGKMF